MGQGGDGDGDGTSISLDSNFILQTVVGKFRRELLSFSGLDVFFFFWFVFFVLYDTQQVDDFGCSSMDSLRRSSGTPPSGPQTLSSL